MSTATQHTIETDQRYWRRDGMLSGTILNNLTSKVYKFIDSATNITYTIEGRVSDLCYDSPEDLVRLAEPHEYNKPSGGDVPDASMLIISPEQYSDMKEIIELQEAKIKKLQAAIDRKNKIFGEVMDMVRYELAKEIG